MDGKVGPNTSAALKRLLPNSWPPKNYTPHPAPATVAEVNAGPRISHRRVVLLDKSIAPTANVHPTEEVLVTVNHTMSLASCAAQVTNAATRMLARDPGADKLKSLTIMAHGAYSILHADKMGDLVDVMPDYDETGEGDGAGGYGMFIGNGALRLGKLDVVSGWKNLFEYIVLLSCGIAYTHPENVGKIGDGQLFCKSLAATTNAHVIGADKIQRYMTNEISNTLFGWEYDKVEATGLDFGKWEGTPYIFSPSGGMERYSQTDFPNTRFL